MTYVGRPLRSFLGSEVFERVGQQAYRIRRADGTIPAAAEVAEVLQVVRGYLADAAAAADGYVLAPRFAIGELVDLTDDAGETVVDRGLRVVDVRDQHLVVVVDRHGRRSTHTSTWCSAPRAEPSRDPSDEAPGSAPDLLRRHYPSFPEPAD